MRLSLLVAETFRARSFMLKSMEDAPCGSPRSWSNVSSWASVMSGGSGCPGIRWWYSDSTGTCIVSERRLPSARWRPLLVGGRGGVDSLGSFSRFSLACMPTMELKAIERNFRLISDSCEHFQYNLELLLVILSRTIQV